jgi:hypothetical protein
MTKEQKLTILDDALVRAYEELEAATRAEMDTPQIKTLLENISAMEWAADKFRYPYGVPVPPVPPEVVEVTGVTEAQIPAEPEPASAAPVAEEPTIPMTEVRAALAQARSKGVNVAAIISSFGVDNFPQIDKSQYPAVLKKLEEALNAT